MLARFIDSLREGCYAEAIEGEEEKSVKRLVDCLPEITAWGKGVWEGVPDKGVEVGAGLSGLSVRVS
jgi:peroxin-3